MLAYSFDGINDNDVKKYINSINTKLNENLPIQHHYMQNRAVLADFLNDNKFIKKLNIVGNYKLKDHRSDIDRFINILVNERNYDQNIANQETFYEDEINDIDYQEFVEKQQKTIREFEIEEAIKRAHDAVDNALKLIEKKKNPILRKENRLVIPEAPLIKNKQNFYYTPENEEVYDYLDKYNHKFNSKNSELLIINTPREFEKAVETWNSYDKYPEENTIKRKDNCEPITTYYFNKITSLESIYEALRTVFMKEVKPFKIHFQLSGVFESQEFDFENYIKNYTYEASEINWKSYRSSIPIIIKDTNENCGTNFCGLYTKKNLRNLFFCLYIIYF